MMEETLFPRGTGSTTESSSSSKKRSTSIDETISANASAFKKSKKEENLFGNDLVKKRRSTALVPKGGSADKGITTLPQGIQPGGGAVLPTSSHPKRDALIESLTFGKLDKGMKLLGCIREDGVTEEYCIVSLPNMLTGFIRRGVGGGDANVSIINHFFERIYYFSVLLNSLYQYSPLYTFLLIYLIPITDTSH